MSQVVKNKISPTQIELTVTVPYSDLAAYLNRAAAKLSENIKIEGFRPGKVPYEIMKKQVGELTILDEAAKELINRTAGKLITGEIKDEDVIGQPQLNITKLAVDNDLEYKITIDTLPEIKLNNYQGFDITSETVTVDEDELAKAIEQLRDMQVKEVVSDKELAMGDKATVDIKMYLDSVPVDGGQAKGVAIILGKNYVVPGFDKELVGLKKDSTKEFELMFPVDHHQKNLAGKKVEFNIAIIEVFERQLPEINDEFASNIGLESADRLMADIKENLAKQKQSKADEKSELAMLEKLVSENPISDLPKSLVDSEAHQMLHEMEHNITGMGGKFADYLVSIKKTHDGLLEEFKPEAEKRIKVALLMREIAKAEKLEASEADIDTELAHMREHYQGKTEALERINMPEFRREMAGRIVNRLVIEKLKDLNFKRN